MKHLISASIALSLLAGTAYAAQWDGQDHQRQDYSSQNRDAQSTTFTPDQRHHMSRGDRLPDQYRQSQYVVNDWQQHNLKAPPRGYNWVRNDNNEFLLAVISSGIIQDIVSQDRYSNDRPYQNDRRYEGDHRYQNAPEYSRGDRLSADYRNDQYVVSNWRAHNLHRPRHGYQWVQVNNRFLLVGTRSGWIVEVVNVNDSYDRNDRFNR